MNLLVKNITLIVTAILMLSVSKIAAQAVYTEEGQLKNISSSVEILEDKNNAIDVNELSKHDFTPVKSQVANLGFSNSYYWIKIPITNQTNQEQLLLQLSLPILDYIEFYNLSDQGGYHVTLTGEEFPFHQRKYLDPNYIFDIEIPKGVTRNFYMKVRSNEAIQLPITIGNETAIYTRLKLRDVLSGLYFGIMLVMILYNLFIYFSVKDRSYIYYVIYILLVLITQTILQGYPYQYLWPNSPVIAKYSLFIFPSLVGIASMVFMNVFLKVREYNKVLFKLTFLFTAVYIISMVLAVINIFDVSQKVMEINAMVVSIFMVVTAIHVIRKGFTPAKYFLTAWVIFLLGVVVFILKDLEVLPYNNFTRYTMQIGSAIETVLLSFALAARINIYKKERLDALEENERIVQEQNIILEKKVAERTEELKQTLADLKQTQSKLVDAEKMSSLGQLTAGIAHEINNPINFVSSNIAPLKRDIDDLKTIMNKYEEIKETDNVIEKMKEIEELKQELDLEYTIEELSTIIYGIEDGARRTTEIVSGLRNFSRLDEGEIQYANINEGVKSTIVLIKNKLEGITINMDLGIIPNIECYPGKLNQMVMNLIDNAIGAIKEKQFDNKEGIIDIKTKTVEDAIHITINDNGIGIEDEVKERIFEPFFTTKEVGQGTGLGLSIVYSIVEQHKGEIEINSEINKGTEITIKLPITKKDE